jgi:hypothetical protein
VGQADGGRREEPEADLRPRDARVAQGVPVAPEIAPPVEAGQQALDDRQHCRLVGIRAQPAQRLVQREHVAGPGKDGALESLEQDPLRRPHARPVDRLDALQLAQAAGRARTLGSGQAAPLEHGPGGPALDGGALVS